MKIIKQSCSHAYIKICKVSVVSVCLFAISSCFDYKEYIYFFPNLSGYIDIDYRVPLYPEEDRSIISFLPVSRDAILKRYERYVNNNQITISNILIEMQSTGLPLPEGEPVNQKDEVEIFRRFASVRYRIHFNSPLVLERILPGDIRIRWLGKKSFQMKRAFPTAGGLPEKTNRLLQSVYKLSRDMFQNKEMVFKVKFPETHFLKSNRGIASEDGVLTFVFPLEKSLNEPEALLWNFSLHLK